jgi:hypothetical protein
MAEGAIRRTPERSTPRARITFGMIVLNAEPFVTYNLRALYPFAHQIIVVEGAAPAAKSLARPDGHSSDGTVDTLRRFKANEDPEGKVVIVTAEDDGHNNGFWPEKDEMSHAYAIRATGDYLWQIDADEFYLPEDIRAVADMLAVDSCITAVSFHMHTFWGAPAYLVDSFFLRKFIAHRVFAWRPGYQYVTHRPPTVLDNRGRDVRTLKSVTAAETMRKGLFLYHYELLFPKQVSEKARYYASVGWTSELQQAEKWVQTCYINMTKPFRVHMAYGHVSWLQRFTGNHPPQVILMMRDVSAGVHPKVHARRTDDIELLLGDYGYSAKREILKWLLPVDSGLEVLKSAARQRLSTTQLWRALQAAKRLLIRDKI